MTNQVCKSSYGLHMVWKFTRYFWKSNYSLLVFPVKRLYLRLCEYCSHGFNIIQRMLSHVKLTTNCKPSVVCSYMGVRQVQIIWFTSHVWCEMVLVTFSTINTNCHQFRNCLKLPPKKFFKMCIHFGVVKVVHSMSSGKHESSLTLRVALNKS